MPHQGQEGAPTKEAEFTARFVLKKGERIGAALTLLGRLIGTDDAVGKSLIDVAYQMVAIAVRFSAALVAGENMQRTRTEAFLACKQAGALLSLAYHAGLITEHNYLTLSEEVEALYRRMESLAASRLYHAAGEGELRVAPDVVVPKTRSGTHGATHIARTRAFTGDAAPPASSGGGAQREKVPLPPSPTPAPAGSAQPPRSAPQGVRREAHERREAILALIGQKGRVGMSDLTKEISGVSAKTIQRELNALIREGLVVREGDRRWSTYRLAG